MGTLALGFSPVGWSRIRRNTLWKSPKMAGLLQPGMEAPTFKAKAVVNGAFGEVDLKCYRGKYVILLWYPEDFSWICPTEIIAFSSRIEEFRAAGAEVLALSCDTANTH